MSRIKDRITGVWQSSAGCAAILFLLAVIVCLIRLPSVLTPREDMILGEEDVTPHWDGRSYFYFYNIPFQKGMYTILADYSVLSDHWMNIREDGEKRCIDSTPVMLPAQKSFMSFRVFVKEDGATAGFEIGEAELSENFAPAEFRIRIVYMPRRTASCYAIEILGFFLLLYALIMLDRHCRRRAEPGYRYILTALILLTVFICAPVFMDCVKDQNDTGFHMQRIAYLAENLFGEAFQYRMQSVWYNGYGYPVSVFYGEYLMVPAAVLYALSVPLFRCYQFYILYVSALKVAISYYSFRKISGNRLYGLFCSVIFAAGEWHLHRAYVHSAMGEFSAMSFLPLVFLGFYGLIIDDDTKETMLHFVMGFSGILQTHMITTVVTAILSVVFCVMMADILLKNHRWRTLLFSAGITLALNLCFFVPFLDYYLRYDLRVEHGNFFIFPSTFYELFMPGQFQRLGLPALLTLVFSLVILFKNRLLQRKRGAWTLFILTILCIGMASVYFPWEWIQKHLPALYRLCAERLQHAYRYLTPATVLVAGLPAVVLREEDNRTSAGREIGVWTVMAAIMVLCVTQGANMMREIMVDGRYDAIANEQSEMVDLGESDELNAVDGIGTDTLANGDELYLTTAMDSDFAKRGDLQGVAAEEDVQISDIVRRGTSFTMFVKNGSGKDSVVHIPVWNYYGYKASGEAGNVFALADDTHGNICLTIPPGYEGKLQISFQPPWYWRVADLLSVLTVVGLFRCRRKDRHLAADAV